MQYELTKDSRRGFPHRDTNLNECIFKYLINPPEDRGLNPEIHPCIFTASPSVLMDYYVSLVLDAERVGKLALEDFCLGFEEIR